MNGGRSKRLREKSVFKIVGIVLLMVLVGLMFTIVDRLPVIGNPDSAPNRHVSDYYIEEGPELTHSPNLVTGVLADFRGFDTLLETTVMFLAGVSVAMILSNRLKRHWDAGIFRKDENFGGFEVKVIMPILIPGGFPGRRISGGSSPCHGVYALHNVCGPGEEQIPHHPALFSVRRGLRCFHILPHGIPLHD